MRLIYSLLFTFFVSVGLSASNSRTLKWFINTSSVKAMVDFKESIHNDNQVLPVFFETQMPSTPSRAYKVRLIFPVFQKLKTDELRLLQDYLKDIPDSIVVKVAIGTERKKQVLDLSFSPFVKKGNSYYKLTSFDWDIKPIASGLRSANEVKTEVTSVSENSILASGKWKKISIVKSGIYKLTYSDIKSLGINPERVQVYGYGGALLEENFSVGGYLNDLPEVAVWKELGNDGVFNDGDFILFYAQGSLSWKYNNVTNLFNRVINHYSDKAYYFIGERQEGTKTPATSTFDGTPTVDVTSFTDLQIHEIEQVNMGQSVAGSGTGRQLFGEDFTLTPTQSFSFDVPDLDTTQFSRARIDFVAKNTGTSSCGIYYNNNKLATMSINSVYEKDDYRYGNLSSSVVSFKPSGKTLTIKLDYRKNGSSNSHRARLDYIALNLRRFLKMSESSLFFRDPKILGIDQVGHYTIQNAGSKPVVFDITNPQEMVKMNGQLNGTDYAFNASASTLQEYVCVDLNGSFPKPTILNSVVNQNIHGNDPVDMVILSPVEYLSYAKRLADAHVKYDKLRVLVVTPEQVYNEFSSGTPDATAYRRMMKFFYDKAVTDSDLPKYLLLFGDGVYDNRLVSTTFENSSSKPNKLLTYQSIESLDGSSSFVSDDYFGFLDDNEGANLGSDKLDIGIGRFTISTEEQAKIAVDKTISYMENAIKGVWKNRLLFLADDPGVKEEYIHQEQADQVANMVKLNNPEFIINKIFIQAYPKVISASGITVPDANNRFAELLNSGLLMVNYTGHGSTTQWAEEKLLTISDIKTMNYKCLPLWVTATCDFTRYDALETSGGEEIFLNPNGGGVALFSTTRVVYSTNNSILNQSFINNIFSKNEGVRNTLGDIMNKSKRSGNLNGDSNKLKFALIGDPALKLAYPEYSAKVTQVNGKDVSSIIDTLHALSKVTVSGEIYREDGTMANDFNGVVSPTVLDAEDVMLEWTVGNSTSTIFERSKVLFSGKDSVRNGRFSFTFIVPKDISYSSKTGNMNLYAYDNTGQHEAQGYFENFVLTGTDVSINPDNAGPKIDLYLNDYDFVSGGSVNETPTLLARISDENGLNTSGNGIGHDLMLTIDGSPSMTYKTNNYYSSDIGSYTSGLVEYVLPQLSAGKHHLTFKAWDVQNNSNIDTLLFEVKPGMAPSISNLKYVQQGENSFFVFTHDRPDVFVSVKLSIYDLLGRMVWNMDSKMQVSENISDTFEWNLTNTNGGRVPNGIYICKIILTDSNGIQTVGSKKIRVAAQ